MPSRNEETYRTIALELIKYPTQTYDNIAKKLGFQTNYGRQTIYHLLQSRIFKQIMNEVREEYYNKNSLKKRLTQLINSTNESVAVRSVELGMKEQAMLTERQEINEKVSIEIKYNSLPPEKEILRLESVPVVIESHIDEGGKVVESVQESPVVPDETEKSQKEETTNTL